MDKLILRLPTETDESQIWAYRQAYADRGKTADGSSALSASESFAAWLAQVRGNLNPATVRPNLMPSHTMLALRESDGILVGFIDIRHTLNDHLLNFGGHIGYSVHPNERRKGYATEMLRQALAFCRTELGLEKALVTCDADNEPSCRTILANGGILEDERNQDGELVQRYWIGL